MNLTQLEYIVTIADERKLSSAAEKLFVTQSALSQFLKKLEDELGTPLFERIGRQLHLTYCGEIYINAAKQILQIKKETAIELDGVLKENRMKVTFGCSHKRGLAMFSYVFPSFYKKYPNVRLELKEANMNELYNDVIEGLVDIAVVSPLAEQPFIVHELLDEEEIVLAIPTMHPLAHLAGKGLEGALDISQLKQFEHDNWMLSNSSSMHRNITDNIFKQVGFFPENILVETSSTDPHVMAVKEGIAVSLIPMPRQTDPSLVIFHLTPTPYRKLYAIYRESYLLSESQKAFIEMLKLFYNNARSGNLSTPNQGW